MSTKVKYALGDEVSIISQNKNRNLSSFIYDIYQPGPNSNVVYLVSTGFGNYVDIDEFYEEDLGVGKLGSRTRSPRKTLNNFVTRPDLINVNCSITGRPKELVLSYGMGNVMREERMYGSPGIAQAQPRHRRSSFYDVDDSGVEQLTPPPPDLVAIKDGNNPYSIGKPVIMKSTGEVALIRDVSPGGTVRLTLKGGMGILQTIDSIKPYDNSPKEVMFKKEDLLEVINQDKSAEEIILDLTDHLTN